MFCDSSKCAGTVTRLPIQIRGATAASRQRQPVFRGKSGQAIRDQRALHGDGGRILEPRIARQAVRGSRRYGQPVSDEIEAVHGRVVGDPPARFRRHEDGVDGMAVVERGEVAHEIRRIRERRSHRRPIAHQPAQDGRPVCREDLFAQDARVDVTPFGDGLRCRLAASSAGSRRQRIDAIGHATPRRLIRQPADPAAEVIGACGAAGWSRASRP